MIRRDRRTNSVRSAGTGVRCLLVHRRRARLVQRLTRTQDREPTRSRNPRTTASLIPPRGLGRSIPPPGWGGASLLRAGAEHPSSGLGRSIPPPGLGRSTREALRAAAAEFSASADVITRARPGGLHERSPRSNASAHDNATARPSCSGAPQRHPPLRCLTTHPTQPRARAAAEHPNATPPLRCLTTHPAQPRGRSVRLEHRSPNQSDRRSTITAAARPDSCGERGASEGSSRTDTPALSRSVA
jgi:hypothetical protein